MKYNLVIDVDGVLSSGQFIYSADGKSHKIFGPHDGDGLKMLRDQLNISFISADKRGLPITKRRIEDMGFTVTEVSEEERFKYVHDNFGFDNTIYIGDGLYDVAVLKQCLLGIAPASARPEARAIAHYVTPSRAAEGAVLDACLEIKRRVLDQAVTSQIIDETPRYKYERLRAGVGKQLPDFIKDSALHTIYLHKGKANLEIQTETSIITQPLSAGQGWYASPNTAWRLLPASADLDVFHVSSQVSTAGPIMQIIDDGQNQIEQALQPYGMIETPKKVNKPWGHELWIMWSRDYHVLKQIGMKAGNQSSLQVHRYKLETNYLVEGQADVIDQLPIDTTRSESEMSGQLKKIDLNDYKEHKTSGSHWTSTPGTVHRVIAATDYIAYETSTPELDDVVRLQDDTNRQSGRIVIEHQANAV